jgi:putative transposase
MKSFTTRQSWAVGQQGQLWQGRFYDRVMRRSDDVRAIAQYILQNPVRGGLVDEPAAYPWSGMLDPL